MTDYDLAIVGGGLAGSALGPVMARLTLPGPTAAFFEQAAVSATWDQRRLLLRQR